MGFYNQFKKFNPKTGDAPWRPFTYLPEIASRARALLKTRTADQIENAASGIDWAITEYFSSLKEDEISRLKNEVKGIRRLKDGSDDTDFEAAAKFFDWVVDSPDNEFSPEGGHWVFNDRMEDELDIQTVENTHEVDALKNCIDWWEDIGGEDFPDGKPEEIFAVLSLWLLADALNWIRYQRKNMRIVTYTSGEVVYHEGESQPVDLASNYSIAGSYALKAMDAVCHAEHLCEVANLESMYKLHLAKNHDDHLKKESERRSMQTEQLSIARHRKTNEAKAKTIEEWEKDRSKFISAEKYGLHLADWLGTQGLQYEPRTVTGWIRAHAKQIGVALR
ncbi:MAG: hypothetical protein ABL869_01010 [Candidatus Nitrotoga sp.]